MFRGLFIQLRRINRKFGQLIKMFGGVTIGILLLVFIFARETPFEYPDYIPKECMNIRKVRADDNVVGTQCIDRSKHPEFQLCYAGVPPSKYSDLRPLVIGSRTMLGMALTRQMRKEKVPFFEIKSKSQFDLNDISTYNIIKRMQCSVIFLLDGYDINNTFLANYLLTSNAPIYIPTTGNEEKMPFGAKKIIIPNLIGPDYFSDEEDSILNQIVKDCKYAGKSNANVTGKEKYASAILAAEHIVKTMKPLLTLKTSHPPERIIVKPSLSASNIVTTAASRLKKCQITMNGHHVVSSEEFSDLRDPLNFAIKQTEVSEDAYASLVFATDGSEEIMKRANIMLKFLDMYLEKYPSTPLEIVHVLAPIKGKPYPMDNFKNLRRHLKTVRVASFYTRHLMKKNNITYFPEFILKNIGIRRSRGDYIICTNADTITPASFLDAVRKRSLTPMALIRSDRQTTRLSDETDEALRSKLKPQGVEHVLYNWSNPQKTAHGALGKHGSGNFMGGPRAIWAAVGGYAEGPWVFHVDTAMMAEFAVHTQQTYVTRFLGAFHISHPFVSSKTEPFPDIKAVMDAAACSGRPTKTYPKFYKGWGHELAPSTTDYLL